MSEPNVLLVLRDGAVIEARALGGLPWTVGSAEGCGVRLEDGDLPALVGEIAASSRGNPRYASADGEISLSLRPGKSVRVGPFTLTAAAVELPEGPGGGPGVEALLDLLPALLAAGDDAAPLEALLTTLARVFGAAWGAVVRLGEDGDPETVVATGRRAAAAGERVSRTVLARLRRSGDPFVGAEVSVDPELEAAESIPVEVQSVIAGELAHAGDREGFVYLESPASRKTFTPEEALLLRRLCALTGELLSRARHTRALDRELRSLDRETRRLRALHHLERDAETRAPVGESPRWRAVLEEVRTAAPADVTVLIQGESGTGKELVARALHAGSSRRGEPFVAVNCAALPAELIESELFGHEKGAFTGADRPRAGRFELAHGGTLFLDEVGELPLEAQGKLLRVLEERAVERLGASGEPVDVDVRVLAATHTDLEARITEGRFREDLLYRLAVFRVALPPLRERPEDIPLLTDRFLERFRREHGRDVEGLTPKAAAILREHPWPGNVRELRNTLLQGFLRTDGTRIRPRDFSLLDRAPAGSRPLDDGPQDFEAAREAFERAFLIQALERAAGDMKVVQARHGLSQTTLYTKCKGYGIRPSDYRR